MVLKQRSPESHVGSWLILIYIFIAMIVIAILFLNTVKVPYEVKETIIIKEPKTETITIDYTEPYEVKEAITEKIPVKYAECGYKDINFSVEYIGDLSKKAYDYRSGTGYLFNPSRGTNPTGRYLQKVRVCNLDIYNPEVQQTYSRDYMGLRVLFEVCHLYDGETVECPSKVNIVVANRPCKDTSDLEINWVAPFDPKRDIKLRPLSVSQKWVCEEKTRFIDGKTQQIIKTAQRKLQKTETKEILVDKPIEKISTTQITLWKKLRNDYGF